MATDPVCGMYVDERTADLKLLRDNRTYYFCASSCLEEFAEPGRQIARLRLKLAVAWPLAAFTLFLTYVAPFPLWPWAALVSAAVVQVYPGQQFYRGTLDALRGRTWNMDVLIAVGTSVAFGYSAAVVLVPGRLPSAVFFDASAFIVTLILTGNYLEHLTRESARGALRRLKEQLPTTAHVVRDGQAVEVPVSEVAVDDRVLVRPGNRFPTDGTVLEGRSSVNEAALTGESLPVAKAPGDPVIAGAVNGEGVLTVRATKVGQDTLLSQIGELVAEAEVSRVPLQRLADRIASVFVPVVLGLAVLTACGWLLAGVGLTLALLAFVSVVITACPCAFGIATPAAIVVGTGRAAEEGILFKGRDSLERASQVDVVLSDKTGTLTQGTPTLTDVVPGPDVSASRLLEIASGLEAGSEHPLAKAVRAGARARGISPIQFSEVRAEPGRGVAGRSGALDYSIIRGSAVSEMATDLAALTPHRSRVEKDGKACSIVLEGGRPLGLLGFADQVRAGAREAVEALHHDGIRVVMVTGDHAEAARRVARDVGIRDVRSDMSPQGKMELICKFQAEGRKVGYVGDGINDAPALTQADLGIAIGAGTEVAREAGGVILIGSDLRAVALALRLARRTVRKVKGNLTWALGYNSILLPVAGGLLVPLLGLRVFVALPFVGAIAMGLSSTTVVLNSLSLRWTSLAR